MNVRLASERDLQGLASVYEKAFNGLDFGEEWTEESAFKLLEYYFKLQPDLFFLAEEGDTLLGGIVAPIKPWWDGNHLTEGEFFVHPAHQHKGVGTKLIKKLFEVALDKYHAVSWDTYTFNVGFQLKWYEKLGFTRIKDWIMISGNIKEVLQNINK